MLKNKYIFILLFGLFLFIPKNTFAETICSVTDINWNTIVSSSGNGCSSLSIPFNANVGYITYRIDSPRLKRTNDYKLDMEWWISFQNWQNVSSEYIQVYNSNNLYPIQSGLLKSQNLGNFTQYTFNTVSQFTSLSDEPFYTVVFAFNSNFTHLNYIGLNYLNVTLEGDNATENAIVNGVTDINNTINEATGNITSKQQEMIDEQKQTNDILNDDNTTGSVNNMESWVSQFQNSFNDHGISQFVTSPLRLIQAFTTENCQPLSFSLPFVHNNVSLQCMKPILRATFPQFYTLWQLLTTGVIGYLVSINILHKCHQLLNPNYDKIEVLNLW